MLIMFKKYRGIIMEKVLITGCAGLVGYECVKNLLRMDIGHKYYLYRFQRFIHILWWNYYGK